MNWQRIGEVHDLARAKAVSFGMHYCEADDSWFFYVRSAVQAEEWVGKNGSFDISIDRIVEWLRKLR